MGSEMCIRDRPWAVRAHLLDPGPFGPICWTLGRSGPIVGPWAVRAQLLDPGPFGPICWTLGRSGPLFGPRAVRAQLLDPGPFGPNCWPLGRSGPLVGHVHSPGTMGMSHAQVGHVPCQVGHVPCPGWACPMPRLGMSHAQGPILGPIWGPIFVWGPFGSHLGTHFLRDEFRGIGRGPGIHLEAEGRLNGGWGAAPPGSYFALFCPILP